MENTYAESFCFYLGIDYDYFIQFYKQWFTIRGITKRINVSVPPAPRFYISIPLKEKSLVYHFDIDTDEVESSLDDMDDKVEETLTPDTLSDYEMNSSLYQQSKFKQFSLDNRNTPDIVRTIQMNRANINRNDSYQTLIEEDMDPGFCSDASCLTGGPALKKLDELQIQFRQMQRDIAGLVQLHSISHSNFQSDSSFTPIMASSPYRGLVTHSPSCSTPPPPPPPPAHSMPPPPPPASIDWRQSITKTDSSRSVAPKGMPDMSEVLKGIASVKLRPVSRDLPRDGGDTSASISLISRTPLRPVTRQESIIAAALRERFQHLRMLNDGESSGGATTSDGHEEEEDNDDEDRVPANYGRAMLRKVGRDQLPATVYRDLAGTE